MSFVLPIDIEEERRNIQELYNKAELLNIDIQNITLENLRVSVIQEEENLRETARLLGVKNWDILDIEPLNKRIKVMMRVRREGLSRLEFDENNDLVVSPENLRILMIEPEQKKTDLTRTDVFDKLRGYRLLTDNNKTNIKRWTRYININDGLLRAGGFPIRNMPNEEFIVMKNVSKKYTFSIKKSEIVLMEKKPVEHNISDEAFAFISQFHNKPQGRNIVAFDKSFRDGIKESLTYKDTAGLMGVDRKALSVAFRNGRVIFKKKWFIFKLNDEDTKDLSNRLRSINPTEIGTHDANIIEIINRYYPRRRR